MTGNDCGGGGDLDGKTSMRLSAAEGGGRVACWGRQRGGGGEMLQIRYRHVHPVHRPQHSPGA